ncbi:MAG: TlpA family protein disulfide reductase [Chitinophagales bacterium]|nr:TlpA family protein disulfide reductase [Chitinophagales bacterium]
MLQQFSYAQDALPDITLFDVDGNKVSISELGKSGKIVVFNFWATWCTPCKKELNNIADIYEDWQADYDVQIVAVSIDDAKTKANVKAYADGQGWEYLVLLDDNKELQRLLNGQTVPFTVVVDQNGMIVEKHSGYVEGDEYILEEKLAELSGK